MALLLFHPDGTRGDFRMLSLSEQRTELMLPEDSMPPFVGVPFVVALPLEIRGVFESTWEKPKEFPAAAPYRGGIVRV